MGKKPKRILKTYRIVRKNVNATFYFGNKEFNKILKYLEDILDSKIKNKKEAEKEYLNKINNDRELL